MKYEYLTVEAKETEHLSDHYLNEKGKSGWELISTPKINAGFVKYILYIFKRELIIDKF